MFYSQQLLARKCALGQIWNAATIDNGKMNRRKLAKINIVQVCEEIMNPPAPMALRLSGILMGGVAIVYERKVKLLYDDVNRLLVEINKAWTAKPVPDPTVLPKRKSQAKREAVTLPEILERDARDLEQSLNSTIPGMEFNQTAYFAMRLDSVDEPYIHSKIPEDPSTRLHQADPDNIMFESFDTYQASEDRYNRFERFDIEEDDEIQLNFTSIDRSQMPTTLIPSPPRQDELPKINELTDLFPEQNINVHSDERKQPREDANRQGATRRRRKKASAFVMDYQQKIIPRHMYQSWLHNTSDIVSRRGRKRKLTNFMSTMKIASLMDLPPVVLSCGLTTGSGEIYYPQPLLHLWHRNIQPPNGSPSQRTVQPLPPRPSSSSPPGQDHMNFPFEDYNSGGGSESLGASIEKLRSNLNNNDMPTQILVDELRANLMTRNYVGMGMTQANAHTTVTPRNSGDRVGFDLEFISEVGARSNEKKPYSFPRHNSDCGLKPIAEATAWQHPDPNFKLRKLVECGLSPDQEPLVESGPTPAQKPDFPLSDKITDSIKTQMKAHFETPGASQVESLDHLASGMNRKGAAQLFYQICVLATSDSLKVKQEQPFGEIFVSKGPTM